MKVSELISTLQKADPNADVMLAFESGIRMDAEIVIMTTIPDEDVPVGTIVITSKDELNFLRNAHPFEEIK